MEKMDFEDEGCSREDGQIETHSFGSIISYTSKPKIDKERMIQIIDCLEQKVETLRKDVIKLVDQRDHLMMTVDMLKNEEFLENLDENECEEIRNYVERVSDRLQTVELHVSTVRDPFQEDSLHCINSLMDEVIRSDDPIFKRKKITEFLNACSSSEVTTSSSMEIVVIDKKFENTLLGCTLDDQKRVRKRLEALLIYLGQKIISE